MRSWLDPFAGTVGPHAMSTQFLQQLGKGSVKRLLPISTIPNLTLLSRLCIARDAIGFGFRDGHGFSTGTVGVSVFEPISLSLCPPNGLTTNGGISAGCRREDLALGEHELQAVSDAREYENRNLSDRMRETVRVKSERRSQLLLKFG
jgi:hypothetical protein